MAKPTPTEQPNPAPIPPMHRPRDPLARVRAFALLGLTLIGLYLCYLLALPFLPALVLALTIAVLAEPAHRGVEAGIRHPGAAAAISVVGLAVIVFLPLAVLAQHLLAILIAGMTSLQKQVASTDWSKLIDSYPFLAWIGAKTEAQNLASVLANVGTWTTNLAASIVKGSLSNAIMVVLTFYLLFYFLRDRREILVTIKAISPFAERETDYLLGRVSDTIHGILFGIVLAAAAQGVLGGLIFWVLGLPNPVFWGAVMALLGVVPVLGAFLIWIPAAIYLASSGEWGKAAILVAYGSVVIGGIDNVLHAALAGGRLRLHTVLVLISIVGGIALFGASGLILGPLVVTMTLATLQIWRDRAKATRRTEEELGPELDRWREQARPARR